MSHQSTNKSSASAVNQEIGAQDSDSSQSEVKNNPCQRLYAGTLYIAPNPNISSSEEENGCSSEKFSTTNVNVPTDSDEEDSENWLDIENKEHTRSGDSEDMEFADSYIDYGDAACLRSSTTWSPGSAQDTLCSFDEDVPSEQNPSDVESKEDLSYNRSPRIDTKVYLMMTEPIPRHKVTRLK